MTQPQALSQPAPRLADTLVVVAYMTVVQAHSSMAALWLPAIAPKVAAAVGLPAAMIGYQVLLMYLGAMTTSLFGGGENRRGGRPAGEGRRRRHVHRQKAGERWRLHL